MLSSRWSLHSPHDTQSQEEVLSNCFFDSLLLHSLLLFVQFEVKQQVQLGAKPAVSRLYAISLTDTDQH